MKKFLIINIAIIISSFIMIIFRNNIIEIDLIINDYITLIRNDNLVLLMKLFSFLGSFVFISLFLIFILIFIKNKGKWFILYIVVSSAIINQFLKLVFARERPSGMLVSEATYSFPSGHAMVSIVFYGLIIYIIYKSILNSRIKIISISILCIVIFLISYSRIYLGVHYLSDIIFGLIIGYLYVVTILNAKKML